MKKNLKKLLWTFALSATSLAPIATSACFVTINPELSKIADLAVNIGIRKTTPYEQINKDALEGQKNLSDVILNKSQYLRYDQNFFSLNWQSKSLNDNTIKGLTLPEEALDVLAHHFINSPLNYFVLENYNKIFTTENKILKFNGINNFYRTYDRIPLVFLSRFNKIFAKDAQTLDINTKFLNLFNEMMGHGLKVNLNQESGIQIAMPSIFLLQQASVDFKNSSTQTAHLFTEKIPTDSEKYNEFIENPATFFNNPENEKYDGIKYWEREEAKGNPFARENVNTLKRLKRRWINEYGAQPQEVAKLIAYLLYFNDIKNVQIGLAYSRIEKKLIHFLELQNEQGQWEFYDIMKFYELYNNLKDQENFAGLTIEQFKPYTKDIFVNDWTFKPTLLFAGAEVNADNTTLYAEALRNPKIKYSVENNQIAKEYRPKSGGNDANVVKLLTLLEKYSNYK